MLYFLYINNIAKSLAEIVASRGKRRSVEITVNGVGGVAKERHLGTEGTSGSTLHRGVSSDNYGGEKEKEKEKLVGVVDSDRRKSTGGVLGGMSSGMIGGVGLGGLLGVTGVNVTSMLAPSPFGTDQTTAQYLVEYEELDKKLTSLMTEKTSLVDENEKLVLLLIN